MREFEVHPPETAGKPVVCAVDFGLSCDSEDNAPALLRALAYCRQVDAGILRLAPGVYRIKNTDFLPVSGRRDFVIDGCGAEMISATSFFFGVTDCERVTLQNLTLDVDWQVMRPANLVRLLSRSGQELELEFLDEDCPPLDLDIRSFNPVDPDRLTPGVPGDAEIWLGSGDIPARRRGAAENRIVLTCTAPAVSALRPGGLYILRRIRKRRGAAFYIEDSRHITMRDNTVYGTFGMVHLVNGHSHHLLFDHEIIRIRPDSRRFLSSDGDGIHIARSNGYLRIENCDFSGMGDDDVNIHDCHTLILCAEDAHTLLTENETVGAPGDPLELLRPDFSPTGIRLTLRGTGSREDGSRFLTTEEPLPEGITEGFLLQNRGYCSDHFIIRRNYFHDHRARGLLLQTKDGLVEDNCICRTQGAGIYIMLETLRGHWYEGTGAGRITVRNNRIVDCNCGGWSTCVDMMATLPDNTSAYTPFAQIRLENNLIRSRTKPACWLSCCDGLQFCGNRLELPSDPGAAVVLERCQNEVVADNTVNGIAADNTAVYRARGAHERNCLPQYRYFAY